MLKENIQDLCDKKKITIMKLEDETGLPRGTVYRWDKAAPNVKSLLKVAQYFHVTIDRLLKGVNYGDNH